MAGTWFLDCSWTMTARFARVNGVNIAYRIQGDGPPLVLVMGYRLSSNAWPATFIQQLARTFTVITLDNRGTGLSDKPVTGYAIANMARDVHGLLDELDIAQIHMLGYSMGGAIAQEFVRQFPERILSLILCATMAGGPHATYAKPSVVRVMRDLDGLSPEQAARRIWKVTYSPGYLQQRRQIAEEQMRREIATPTPLHAADLQFQAFAEFDGSKSLAEIRCPTLILTGDRDDLISPQNSRMMAGRIPGAKLIVLPGRGHRVLWEATDDCLSFIGGFLTAADPENVGTPRADNRDSPARDALTPALTLLSNWPGMLAEAAWETVNLARQSMIAASSSRFGDGKPIILIPPHLGGDLPLIPISIWLNALGYRPAMAGLVVNLSDGSSHRMLARLIHETTERLGRKAVLITHSTGMTAALRAAGAHSERISDVVVFEAPHQPSAPNGIRTHQISSRWSVLPILIELPRLLRAIDIELIQASGLSAPGISEHEIRISAEEPKV
jgi:pimeloyl-ACP methyl ester carboxylesterase